MPSGQELINEALVLTGELRPGQTPNVSESNRALIALNQIIDSANIQDTMATSSTQGTVSCVSGTQTYALATRVVKITGASIIMAAGPTMPLKVVQSTEEWNALPDRDSSSNLVKVLFYDRGFPTGTVYLSPKPLSGLTVAYNAWLAQPSFASLATPNTLLPGYELWLVAELAIKCCAFYERVPSDSLKETWSDARAAIRSLNAELWNAMAAEAEAA